MARDQIVEVCRRMHDRRLISGGEGNVSIRLGPNRIVITPSGANKGFLAPGDLIVVDPAGNVVKGRGRPSSESRMHLMAYRIRPDCGAVVHAHPPTAVAFTIAGLSLAQCVVPESILALGEIRTAPYATPTTRELADELEPFLARCDAVLMDRHGSVTLGRTVYEAYDRLESLEHTAEITLKARMLGPVRPLPPSEIARLKAMAASMGVRSAPVPCGGCGACNQPEDPDESAQVERIVASILSRVTPSRAT